MVYCHKVRIWRYYS